MSLCQPLLQFSSRRFSQSLSHHTQQLESTFRRLPLYCHRPCRSELFSTTTTSSTTTGSVKFYLREKGYGFIQVDDNPNVDLFVHYSSIVTPNPIPNPEEIPNSHKYPFLKKNERVRCRIQTSSNGMDQAVEVRWLNGDAIPPLRRNFLGGVHERNKLHLGEAVYDALLDEDEDEDEDSESAAVIIQQAFEEAKANIQAAEELVTNLGMQITDFPTVKSREGRGRYQFTSDENTNTDSQNSVTDSLEGIESNRTTYVSKDDDGKNKSDNM